MNRCQVIYNLRCKQFCPLVSIGEITHILILYFDHFQAIDTLNISCDAIEIKPFNMIMFS